MNRRSFLKRAGIGAGAVASVGLPSLTAERAPEVSGSQRDETVACASPRAYVLSGLEVYMQRRRGSRWDYPAIVLVSPAMYAALGDEVRSETDEQGLPYLRVSRLRAYPAPQFTQWEKLEFVHTTERMV